jgi:hypothetical protein
MSGEAKHPESTATRGPEVPDVHAADAHGLQEPVVLRVAIVVLARAQSVRHA